MFACVLCGDLCDGCGYTLDEHASYWAQYPGKYEHWRFEDGFVRGWEDAWLFFMSVSFLLTLQTLPEIGFKGVCAKRRGEDHVKEKGKGNLWEFGKPVQQLTSVTSPAESSVTPSFSQRARLFPGHKCGI